MKAADYKWQSCQRLSNKHTQCFITEGGQALPLCLKADFGQILYFRSIHFAVLFLLNNPEQSLSETRNTFYARDIFFYLCQTPWYDNAL